ncbi:transposable element Tcb1 transposase [Trichonephila clavipes]|nr:transposable element Tcb1 transposase [Trichonephila clavipes]
MKFSEGFKSFEMCTNSSCELASPAHNLECLELTKQDLADDPLLVLDFPKVKIGSRVGRNQTIVLRICDRVGCRRVRWTKVVDSIHLSAPLHQSGLSARRPLIGLPLTQNPRRLCRQWCDERRMWVAEWNEVVLTEESRICLQHHDGRIRVWRHRGERMLNSCVMNPPLGSCTGYYGMERYWISLSYSSSTHCWYFKKPALHLRGVGASCPSLPSELIHSHISTGQCATTRGTLCPKVLRQSSD